MENNREFVRRMIEKKRAAISYRAWEKHTNSLDWMIDARLSPAYQDLIRSACSLAYKCGRKHEQTLNALRFHEANLDGN